MTKIGFGAAVRGWVTFAEPAVLPLLLIIIALRGFSLEAFDLIDPSEARYAFVSQHMLYSGDWLMPHLPDDGLTVPYFSKPPLHFWMAAFFSKFFGFDEWVVRLPSFFAYCLLIWLSGKLAALLKFPERARRAAPFVTASLGLLFILSGSATVDVTFSTFISVALVYLVHWLQKGAPSPLRSGGWWVATAGLGFAILTKGPAAIVFFAVPAVAAVYAFSENIRTPGGAESPRRSFARVLFALGLMMGCAVGIALPWYLAAEYYYPGYLRYFLLTENLSRFAAQASGDRYGAPHAHTHGSIIPVAFLVFLPWSPLVIMRFGLLWKSGEWRGRIWRQGEFFAWAMLLWPLTFLTISTTWLPAYLLPAVLGVSLVSSMAVVKNPWLRRLRPYRPWLHRGLALLFAVAMVGGLIVRPTVAQIVTFCFVGGLIWIVGLMAFRTPRLTLPQFSLVTATLLFCVVIMWSPYGSARKSTREALAEMALQSSDATVELGVVNEKAYSIFVYSSESKQESEAMREVSKPVTVHFMEKEELASSTVKNLLLNKAELQQFAALLSGRYEVEGEFGKWTWLRERT